MEPAIPLTKSRTNIDSSAVVTSKFTTEYAARVNELRGQKWQDIKSAAEAVDIELPEGQKWQDLVELIVRKELDGDIYLEGFSPEEIAAKQPLTTFGNAKSDKAKYSDVMYAKLGIRTGKDGDKIRTGLDGKVLNN